MKLYTIHSGDEFDGDGCYSVLKGPNGFECWLTEPEDRSWQRDGNDVVQRLEQLEAQLATVTQERDKLRVKQGRLYQDREKVFQRCVAVEQQLVAMTEKRDNWYGHHAKEWKRAEASQARCAQLEEAFRAYQLALSARERAVWLEAAKKFDVKFYATDHRLDNTRDYRVDEFYKWCRQQATTLEHGIFLNKEHNGKEK